MFLGKREADEIVRYTKHEVAPFYRASGDWGVFSNFAPYQLEVQLASRDQPQRAPTSKHLYQALKYPEDRNKQMAILQQWSPKEAAELGRESSWQPAMRSDWDEVRHAIMDWVVRYKWLSYQLLINRNLDTTAGRPIVEVSPVDAYWGAIPQPNGELVGANVLGKIWMQVRKELEDGRRYKLATYTLYTTRPGMALVGEAIQDRITFDLKKDTQ